MTVTEDRTGAGDPRRVDAGEGDRDRLGSARSPLGTDAGGAHLPALRDRLVPPLPATGPLWWLSVLVITAIAGLLRFWDLGRPHSFVFDETYYAKDAWSLLNHGVERNYPEGADATILKGDTRIWEATGSFIVHPPLGKWMIALGEAVFGMDPVGWRVVTALCGTVLVLVMARLVRRLTRSNLLPLLAALLMAVDGLAIVESRTALLDSLLAFWLVLGAAALLVDRDRTRARLAEEVTADPQRGLGGGPRAGWRPWRLVAGVCFGLACSTKWNGVFLLAVAGVLAVLWDVGARRAVGVRRPWWSALRLDAAPAFFSLVGTSVVVYTASWSGWFATSSGYDRQWGMTNAPSAVSRLFPTALRSWWHYHAEMLNFNTGLRTPHPYQSDPIGWLLMVKPVAFAYTGSLPGNGSGCATNCTRAIHALGTPALWWGGVAALVVCAWLWLAGRDWRAGFALAGVLGTWVPWLFFAKRTIFSFYAIATLPFLVIAVVLVIGTVLDRVRAHRGRSMPWVVAACGVFVVLVVVDSGFLYPVLTDQLIPYDAWRSRMWFASWIG